MPGLTVLPLREGMCHVTGLPERRSLLGTYNWWGITPKEEMSQQIPASLQRQHYCGPGLYLPTEVGHIPKRRI